MITVEPSHRSLVVNLPQIGRNCFRVVAIGEDSMLLSAGQQAFLKLFSDGFGQPRCVLPGESCLERRVRKGPEAERTRRTEPSVCPQPSG